MSGSGRIPINKMLFSCSLIDGQLPEDFLGHLLAVERQCRPFPVCEFGQESQTYVLRTFSVEFETDITCRYSVFMVYTKETKSDSANLLPTNVIKTL